MFVDESLEHLFVQCKYAVDFWLLFVKWLNEISFHCTKLYAKETTFPMLNQSILTGKQLINQGRKKCIFPSLGMLVARIKYIYIL